MTWQEPEQEIQSEQLASEQGIDLGGPLSPEEAERAKQIEESLIQRYPAIATDAPGEPAEPAEPAEPEEEEEGDEEEEAPAPEAAVPAEGPEPDREWEAATAAARARTAEPSPEVAQALALRQWLIDNPAYVELLQNAEAKKNTEPEPDIPEWVDQDDPFHMGMWAIQVDRQRQVNQLVADMNARLAEDAQTKAQRDYQEGLRAFTEAHPELTADDLQRINIHAVSNSYMQTLAGSPEFAGRPAGAVTESLEMAYWRMPQFRASQTPASPGPSEKRKARLSALSGSSGAMPRTQEQRRPGSDKEMRDMMIPLVRQALAEGN